MNRPDQPLGELLPDGGLRYLRHLAHPPESVWRALTEPDHLRHWFPADIVGERRAGAALELPFWPAQVERYGIEQPVTHGQLLAWEPPRLLELTWETDRLRFELAPEAAGTQLTFTTWLGDTSPQGIANAGAGWHVCLDQLLTLLDTGRTDPLEDAAVATWEQRYAAALPHPDSSAEASQIHAG